MLRAFSASICCCACVNVAPGRECQWPPELDRGIDEEEIGRQDADDRLRLAVDPQGLPHGVVSPAVELLPEAVAQDDLTIGADFTLGLGEDAAAERLRAEQPQQGGPRQHAGDPLRIAVDANRHAARVVERLFVEGVDLSEPVVVVRHAVRRAFHAGPRIAVAERRQPLRLRHRQRLQQHGVDDGKDGRVDADAERQRQQRRDGKRPVLPQQPEAEAEILKQSVHRAPIRKTLGARSPAPNSWSLEPSRTSFQKTGGQKLRSSERLESLDLLIS